MYVCVCVSGGGGIRGNAPFTPSPRQKKLLGNIRQLIKGSFTHSRIAPRIITPGSSVLSPASPCIYTPGRHPVWSLAHRHIRGNFNFPSRSTRMKNYPYHSWKAPCSYRVAIKYIREFRTGRMPVLIRSSRWLYTGRNTVPSTSCTDHFSSVFSGTKKMRRLFDFFRLFLYITDICRCAND